jgi:putative acetyltransferase
MIEILPAAAEHTAPIQQLFKQYLAELNEDICFQGYEVEFANPLGFYETHCGQVLLAFHQQEIVGCVAYKNRGEGRAEMKRLYVPPPYRKLGAGKLLVQAVEKAAQAKGYTTMVLDTLERLTAAVKLYQQLGYGPTQAYYHNPLPGVLYFEKGI